jgi:hypothetical protein
LLERFHVHRSVRCRVGDDDVDDAVLDPGFELGPIRDGGEGVLGAEDDAKVSEELTWEVGYDVHMGVVSGVTKPSKRDTKCEFTLSIATLAFEAVVSRQENTLEN